MGAACVFAAPRENPPAAVVCAPLGLADAPPPRENPPPVVVVACVPPAPGVGPNENPPGAADAVEACGAVVLPIYSVV